MKITDVRNAAWAVGDTVGHVASCCVTIGIVAVAPIVSLVALPIFGLKLAYTAIESNILCHKTFTTNHTRQPHGRIAGQDYTRWDGTGTVAHIANGDLYYHGCPDGTPEVGQNGHETAFKTEQDLQWLRLEYAHKEADQKLKDEIERIKIIAIGIIPIVGVVGYLAYGILSNVCGNSEAIKRETTWNWKAAINFHIENLKRGSSSSSFKSLGEK